jgi:shikimate kinase
LTDSSSVHSKNAVRILGLTGFMGSGKSTVGQLLARQIGWHTVDLDHRIVESSGLSVQEIFSRRGETGFRELERQELLRTMGEALSRERNTILSLGGGTITRADNLALLRQGGTVLVWLRCPMEELLRRCAQITDRPLFRDEAAFHELYRERLPFYEMADYRVDTECEPARVVEQILALGVLNRFPA